MTLQSVQTERPYKVWRVLVNDTEAASELVYHEPDEAVFLSLSLTHNRQHILLQGESHATHYVSTLSAADPTGELQSHWWQWLGPSYSAPVSTPESYTACQEQARAST